MNLIETSDGYGDLVQRLRGRSAFLRNKHGRVKSPEVMEEAIAEIERLTAQVEGMREALGEICRDSNPDWTEKRVYPCDVLDDIHKIAVSAYYEVQL